MNNLPVELLQMKSMGRAMVSYVLFLWEIAYESNAQDILEIGVRQAQSTRTFLSALKHKNSGTLTSIDLRDRKDRFDEYPTLLPYWRPIVGNSHKQETFDQVKDKKYDIILIDGDHTYEGVKQDFEMYAPLAKKDALIIFHDVSNRNEGVKKFWLELNVPNKITFNWGRAAKGVIPGLGIIQV